MAINPNTFVGPALTDVQGELTAKIGSMKSLLALPNVKKPNIPKEQQISAFDYLLRVLNALGIDPQVVFNAFLSKVFDETGTFLEEKVIFALADSFGEKGIQLSPYVNNAGATKEQKKIYKESNKQYLLNIIPNTFLQVVKQKISKDLMIMVFGPKDGPAAQALNPSASERDKLISNAVCGLGIFAISNEPQLKNSDLEYTRIKRRQELEKGEVIFEISCQDIKIKLPEDPSYIFQGGGVNSVGSTLPPTPYQSIIFTNQYVNNQFQRINNESNANKGGKSFLQILIEFLLSYISVLVQPYLPNVFTIINAQVNPSTPFQAADFAFDNCAINDDPSNSEKKEFARSLMNALLKDLIKLLLVYGIKYFKRFVKNYFAKKALERQKRKLQKQTLKYEQVLSKVQDTQDKIQKYQAALSVLTDVLGGL